MSSYLPGLGGGGDAFSPADFGSAEDSAPTAVLFDIGGNGQSNPYTIAVNGMLNKHIEEMRGKATATVSLSATWKRRFREFMSKKNADLMGFVKATLQDHPVFGRGEMLLRRFGNPNSNTSHPSIRDMVLDVSGETAIVEVEEAMKALSGSGPLKDLGAHITMMYEMYRESGEAAMTAQNALKVKLDRLDRIQGKLANLFEIEVNDKYEQLMEANELYIKKLFEDANIEADYKATVEAYRKFLTLRDTVLLTKAFSSVESQPICSICIEEPVTHTVSPCGHTFCLNCIKKHTSNTCFICRTPIRDKIKLFFG